MQKKLSTKLNKWSGWPDLNRRPPHPQCGALPGCATSRINIIHCYIITFHKEKMSLIECKAGKFEGLFKNECHHFFGIPYAKYEHRWSESAPIEDELIFKASETSNTAPQTRSDDQAQMGTSFFPVSYTHLTLPTKA